ncbi:VanZ family protein [Terrilactibacillus tamarindi]|uniref:VanZ family protein n=1 Tax=Terrilactibacillus tamarindi TaxID=2599694 RepID=UPI002E36266A|nr:VanZ family protein [Terrilactibacillus tamarindi]
MNNNRWFLNILTIFSILFIFYMTILPHSELGIGVSKGFINLNPFLIFKQDLTYSSLVVNDLGNILLFVPFGFLLTMRFPHLKLSKVVLFGCLLSITIECIQLFMANRCTDIDDIILNTFGALVGYLVCVGVRYIIK